MDKKELEKLLPHRDPMLLLDEVTLEGETALGKYCVRGDEFFLQGHFPGNPVVPGVILCEILAQTACVLVKDGMAEGKTPLYTTIEKTRFRSPVYPGDRIETSCRLIKVREPFYYVQGTVMVGGKLKAQASFSFVLM